jgi:stage IV sporulation protein FB
MSWSLSIGRIAGTAIRIHITFLLFLVWIWAASYVTGGTEAAWNGLIFMVLLFLCVLAHEFGHIFTARAFGVQTPDVTLLPIGGVARLERIPEEPGQEFLIAIAGPAVNVVIALALMSLTGADMSARHLAAVESAQVPMAERLASVNLFLAAFNMIPAFPMDGGRVLRALLAIKLGFTRATDVAATIGQWVAFALGFIGLFSNPLLIFIAIFVYLAASSEAQLVQVRAMSRGVPVSAAMMTQFATLAPQRPDRARSGDAAAYQPERVSGGRPGTHGSAWWYVTNIIKALRAAGPQAAVAGVMRTDIPTISHRRWLDEALKLLQEKSAPAGRREKPTARFGRADHVGDRGSKNADGCAQAMPQASVFGPWSRPARGIRA